MIAMKTSMAGSIIVTMRVLVGVKRVIDYAVKIRVRQDNKVRNRDLCRSCVSRL